MTQDTWLMKHPYLCEIAALHELVGITVESAPMPPLIVPLLDDYTGEFHAGVPLLHSSAAKIDVRPAGKAFATFVEVLSAKPLPDKLAFEVHALVAALQSDADFPCRAIAWLLKNDSFTPEQPGLLLFLGWTVMARYLEPLVAAFAQWRDEEHWLRRYCPMCGASPAMGLIVHGEPASLRFLSCGFCRTRWRYPRTRCAFCDSQDDQEISVLSIAGEDALRIAYCEACEGYLKTYSGKSSERFFLADWTSIHLDVIAQDRGLKRYAGSRYQL